MSNKKVNPRRQPISANDAYFLGKVDGINRTLATTLTVLVDKNYLAPERLEELSRDIQSLSESINEGYVNAHDLMRTLEAEYGVHFV